MSTAQQGENRPPQPAPEGQSKERLDVALGYWEGTAYEIPLEVAARYESEGCRPIGSEADEVGGRHAVRDPASGLMYYHQNWMHGPYVWIRDGRTYRGPHWHPWRDSRTGCDMDDY